MNNLDPDIFRSYDIRGMVDRNFTPQVVYRIARALAAMSLACNQRKVAVAADVRLSSPVLAEQLIRGLAEGELEVVDLGRVPTPLLYFATRTLDIRTGVMLTGSHNPPEYNGMKIVLAGDVLADEGLQELRRRVEPDPGLPAGTPGTVTRHDVVPAYIARICEDIRIARPLKVVVDCGNGVAGTVAPDLFRALGCDIISLYCEPDGRFPNHHPDPAEPDNMRDLAMRVVSERADLGIAFDGDGDRVGAVTELGRVLWSDNLLLLFAADILVRHPQAIVLHDVKCTRQLDVLVRRLGGRAHMIRTGHSHLKAQMKRTGALLGGEFSGHICFSDRWYGFDDALYAAARLAEIVGREASSMDALCASYAADECTPEIKIVTTDKRKFTILDDLRETVDFADGRIDLTDGLRVEYMDGWGLVRASNTSPVLTLRFEAKSLRELRRIQEIFATALETVSPELDTTCLRQ